MREQQCPKCGSEHWYPTGTVSQADLIIAQMGGPKAPITISIRGGHCLSCDHEETAVYELVPEAAK